MKIIPIIIILFLANTNFLVAQTDTIKYKFLKIYSNASYSEYQRTNYNEFITDFFSSYNVDFTIGFLSISIEKFLKNGDSHEFEILPIKMNYKYYDYNEFSNNAAKIYTFETSLRYQYNNNFIKNLTKKYNIYCGVSLEMFYFHQKIIPIINTFYYQRLNQIGLGFSVIPGYSYKINDKYSLDFNIPFRLGEIVYEKKYIDNPSLPTSSQYRDEINIIWIPTKLFFRLGLIIKI